MFEMLRQTCSLVSVLIHFGPVDVMKSHDYFLYVPFCSIIYFFFICFSCSHLFFLLFSSLFLFLFLSHLYFPVVISLFFVLVCILLLPSSLF